MQPDFARRSFPNLWQGTGVALVYLALGSWMGLLASLAAQAFGFPAWTALLPALILGFPLALAFGLWLGRLDLWEILAFRPVKPGLWMPLLVTHLGFFVLVQALAHGMEVGLDRLLPAAFHQGFLKEAEPLAHTPLPLLALLFAGAAIPEEILFRGFILRGLLGHHRPAVAIWLSTGLFIVAHGNLLQVPVALMLGACAGWYFQATGSLWPGLVVHALHNLLITLLLEVEALASGSLVVNPLPPPGWLLAAPFLAGFGLLWLRREFNRPQAPRLGVLDLS